MGTHPIFESNFDCLTEMPPKRGAKKEAEPKAGELTKETKKKLEALDSEDFHEESAAHVRVKDTLEKEIFDWVPDEIVRDDEEGFVVGIDEAGRGPVLGPMVYSAAFCKMSSHQAVREDIGCNDSKQLKEIDRERMLKSTEKSKWIGYTGVVLPPAWISSGMLGRRKYNLNLMSHDTAIAMIRRIIDVHKVNVKEVFVDTVGKPEFYEEKLSREFPRLRIKVESKADATYPIVGAASIVAKVSRDHLIHKWSHLEDGIDPDLETGSGYPGDPKSKAWLRNHLDPVFGLPSFARLSWGTSQELMKKNCLEIEWEDQDDEDEEKQKTKLKAGSKRGEALQVEKKKGRKSAFFREHKIARTNFQTFFTAF